jgi:hypothetical protein
MATAYISTNTELSLVNTISQNLTLFLPQNPINGRNLFVKDAAGNSFRSSITLSTLGTDTFEDNSVLQTLNSAYESMQLTYNSNVWYFTGGMMFNTLRASTLQALTVQTSNLSTLNATLSSFQIFDVPTSSIGTFNTVSSFLLYNGFNIGGGLRTAIPQTLNRFRFSPQQVPGLALWVDAADSNTILTSGGFITRWNDKSGFNRHLTATSADCTYGSGIVNGLNAVIMPQATTTFGFTSPTFVLAPNNRVSAFIVFQTNLYSGPSGSDFVMISGPNASDYQIFFRTNRAPPTAVPFGLYCRLNGVTGGGSGYSPAFPFTYLYQQVFDSLTNIVYINGSFSSSFLCVSNNIITAPRSFRFFYNFAQGYACEVIIVNDAVNNTNRFILEGYLAWKWGFQTSLPASHPYRNAPPQ